MIVILGHMWLMEHIPELDWCTGDIHMTRCPSSCRPDALMDCPSNTIQPNDRQTDKTKRHPKAKHCHQVHIKEVQETEPTETELPLGFTCPDLDEMDQGDQLLVWFIGMHPEEVGVMQTICQ